jgi:hypothetical protein
MTSLAKPGGIVAVRDVDYEAMRRYPEIPRLREWSDNYVAVARIIGCDPNLGRRLHAIAIEAEIQRRNIEASAHTWVFSAPEERTW